MSHLHLFSSMPLSPRCRFLLPKVASHPLDYNSIIKDGVIGLVIELQALKATIEVLLTSYTVAMVICNVEKIIITCSLVHVGHQAI